MYVYFSASETTLIDFEVHIVQYPLTKKDTRLSPLFHTTSDGKLGRAWERGYPLTNSGQYSPCGLHERCAAGLGLMVDVGALVYEELDHTLVSLPAGKGERGIVVTARWNIDLGPRVQEKLCSFVVALSIWRNKFIAVASFMYRLHV